jgi:hypothetical protein
MFGALFSFLGGSVFRMIWGEASSFLNKRQDHQYEIERLRLQSDLDAAEHARAQETLRLQAELGIKTVEAQSEAALAKADADAFTAAMQDAFKATGIFAVDLWNGVIRPAGATIVLALWVAKLWAQGGKMDPWDMELGGAILGFFYADRSLGKRGK